MFIELIQSDDVRAHVFVNQNKSSFHRFVSFIITMFVCFYNERIYKIWGKKSISHLIII